MVARKREPGTSPGLLPLDIYFRTDGTVSEGIYFYDYTDGEFAIERTVHSRGTTCTERLGFSLDQAREIHARLSEWMAWHGEAPTAEEETDER